jgi:hypothetical protein
MNRDHVLFWLNDHCDSAVHAEVVSAVATTATRYWQWYQIPSPREAVEAAETASVQGVSQLRGWDSNPQPSG